MQRVMTKALGLFGIFWLLLNETVNIYFFWCLQGLKTDAIKAKQLDRSAFKGKLFSHQAFCKQVAKLHPGQAAVITNGRVSVLFFVFCFISVLFMGRETFFIPLLTINKMLGLQLWSILWPMLSIWRLDVYMSHYVYHGFIYGLIII